MNALPSTLEEVRNIAKAEFAANKNGTLAALFIQTAMEGLPLVYVNRDLQIKTMESAKREGLVNY